MPNYRSCRRICAPAGFPLGIARLKCVRVGFGSLRAVRCEASVARSTRMLLSQACGRCDTFRPGHLAPILLLPRRVSLFFAGVLAVLACSSIVIRLLFDCSWIVLRFSSVVVEWLCLVIFVLCSWNRWSPPATVSTPHLGLSMRHSTLRSKIPADCKEVAGGFTFTPRVGVGSRSSSIRRAQQELCVLA